MSDSTIGQRLFRSIPLLSLALIVPALAWAVWQDASRILDAVALGVFVYVLIVALVSDHALGRAARARLSKLLGRTVVEGEETSLNTWMRVPSSEIDSAADELEQISLEVEGAPLDRRRNQR